MIIYKDIEDKEFRYETKLSEDQVRQCTKWCEKEEEIKNQQKKLQEAEERLTNGLEDWEIKQPAIKDAIKLLKREFVRLDHLNKDKIISFAKELTKLMEIYELTLDCFDDAITIRKRGKSEELNCYIEEHDNIYEREPFYIAWGA